VCKVSLSGELLRYYVTRSLSLSVPLTLIGPHTQDTPPRHEAAADPGSAQVYLGILKTRGSQIRLNPTFQMSGG